MSRAMARAPVEALDETDDAGDELDEAAGAGEAGTLAKPRVVQAVPYRPVRTAMRDELGRRVVTGAVTAGAAVLPGLAVTAVAGLVGWRLWTGLRDAWAAWQAKRKGDPAIKVKVMPAGERRWWPEERRVVDVGLAGDAPAPAPKAPKDARRLEFLLAREAHAVTRKRGRGRR